jgi:hypothetical protein
MVSARTPARAAASTWLRINASSGDTMTVGPAPPARSSAVATKYTADLPHPVRCTTSARRRSRTSASIAVHWSSRSRAPGPASAASTASARSRRSVRLVVMAPSLQHDNDSARKSRSWPPPSWPSEGPPMAVRVHRVRRHDRHRLRSVERVRSSRTPRVTACSVIGRRPRRSPPDGASNLACAPPSTTSEIRAGRRRGGEQASRRSAASRQQ